jgi:hypothetical protein
VSGARLGGSGRFLKADQLSKGLCWAKSGSVDYLA